MMKYLSVLFVFLTVAPVLTCGQGTRERPNVVLIMADDMAHISLGAYGSPYYRTPVLDSLAERGMWFGQAIAQPLCTPSRVKLMTGQPNYHNYDYFGYLHPDERTFGHLMREAGYATCIAGKWQLNGLAFELEGFRDASRPRHFGFDEYCLWQLTQPRSAGERFADPLIEQNGKTLDTDIDDYGPDIFTDYVLDFIERHQEQPFFVYYPMVLVHEPFVPTPDVAAWREADRRYERDTAYFADMVAYTDKLVGRIADRLRTLGLDENTLLIFTADNGTHPSIQSPMPNGLWRGAKGNTIDLGVHVPLIAYQPGTVVAGRYEGLVDFSDFFPTFQQLVGQPPTGPGQSFLPVLWGKPHPEREQVVVYYDPRWGQNVNRYRGCFAQSGNYKLYQDGRFFNLAEDYLEESPLDPDHLGGETATVYRRLRLALADVPAWYQKVDR